MFSKLIRPLATAAVAAGVLAAAAPAGAADDGLSNTIMFARQADGIIAILIGAVADVQHIDVGLKP